MHTHTECKHSDRTASRTYLLKSSAAAVRYNNGKFRSCCAHEALTNISFNAPVTEKRNVKLAIFLQMCITLNIVSKETKWCEVNLAFQRPNIWKFLNTCNVLQPWKHGICMSIPKEYSRENNAQSGHGFPMVCCHCAKTHSVGSHPISFLIF